MVALVFRLNNSGRLKASQQRQAAREWKLPRVGANAQHRRVTRVPLAPAAKLPTCTLLGGSASLSNALEGPLPSPFSSSEALGTHARPEAVQRFYSASLRPLCLHTAEPSHERAHLTL